MTLEPRDIQEVPAQCRRCGTVYGSGLEIADPEVTEVGVQLRVRRRPARCPRCGTTNGFQPGWTSETWNVVREGARLVGRLPSRDAAALLDVVQSVKAGQRTVEEAKAAADSDVIRKFWDVAPRTRSELYAFLALIVAVLTLYLSDQNDGAASPEQVEKIVETVIRESRVPTEPPQPPPAFRRPEGSTPGPEGRPRSTRGE